MLHFLSENELHSDALKDFHYSVIYDSCNRIPIVAAKKYVMPLPFAPEKIKANNVPTDYLEWNPPLTRPEYGNVISLSIEDQASEVEMVHMEEFKNFRNDVTLIDKPGSCSAKMVKGELLGHGLGSGFSLKGDKVDSGISTYSLYNVFPQFHSSYMWYFYNIEMKVLQSLKSCAPGTFYLITGVENYKQFIYTNSTNRVEERVEGKKLESGQFSFPKIIWVAGCCIPNSSHLDSTPELGVS